MRRTFSTLVLLLLIGSTAPARAQTAPGVPAFDHIFVVVFENHSDAEVIGNSTAATYFNELAAQYGTARNYWAVSHPSLPNYIALVGGDTFGISSDCTACDVGAPNLPDRIVASGRTWKAYMEGMPSACMLGDAYPYAQKHNPFIYFDDLRTSPDCQNTIVPLSNLYDDLSSAATTPSFVWITPDLCNDMHDCSISRGDEWLRTAIGPILQSPSYTTQHSLVLITFDEDNSSEGNRVASLVIAPDVPPGYQSYAAYDHYSLLRTIEAAWGLDALTTRDAAATPMADFFAPAR